MAKEADKVKERQRIRDACEPGIKALQKKQTELTTQINHLKTQKIFLDSNVESILKIEQEFPAFLDKKEEEFSEISNLKGNYMKFVKSESNSIIGHGKKYDVRNTASLAEDVQSTLEQKIQDLQTDLSNTIRDTNDSIFLMQRALDSII